MPLTLVRTVKQELVEDEDGVPASYANLDTALRDLDAAVGAGEALKLKAARIVQRIRDAELYREAGAASFPAYLPELANRLKVIGWKSERAVRYYLSLADVYLDQLHIEGQEALGSASHLFELLKLAQTDRETGELLMTPDKEGKVGAVQFEALAQVINWMVSAAAPADKKTGLGAEELSRRMADDARASFLNTAQLLVGAPFLLPAGGWTLEDTKALVAKLQGKEEKQKVSRTWVVASDNEEVVLGTLEIYRGESLIQSFPLGGEVMGKEAFEEMVGKDRIRWTNTEA